jgi:hypothetical protein
MWLIYSTEVSLFFNIIPEHIDALAPSWHEFKNFVAVEIGLLHSQPFTNSHFHFFVTVETGDLPSVASEAQTNGSPTGQSAATYRKTKCLINTKVTD